MSPRIVRRKASSSSGQQELKLLDPGTTSRNPGCQKCSLWESAETPCLWGVGDRMKTKLMIITDAPDHLADRGGKPFSNSAGKLLMSLLESIGITRSECYITHAVKCKPPEGRPPTKPELKTCKPYLLSEIADLAPSIILTLGASAFNVLAKGKITEQHGQMLDFNGVPLIATFAPGAALRDPARLPALRKDIMRLGFAIRGELPTEDDLHWQVIRTLAQWNEFLDEFKASKEVAVDIETTGLDSRAPGAAVNTIQFGLDNHKNYALPLSVRDSPWPNREQHLEFLTTLIEFAEGKVITGQNFKFDNTWLKTVYGVKFHLSADTMLMHHLLDENSSHGLKEMATEFCNAPSYDIDLKTKLGLGDLVKYYKYGCFDTHYTYKLYKIFRQKLLKHPALRRLFYKLVMPAARMFEDIEEDGLCINVEQLDATEKLFTDRKNKILAQMNKMAGVKVNWNSPQQVGELFFKTLGLPILEKTNTGKPSTSESVMLRLKDEHPLAALLVEYRGIEKNLSTYILGWKKLMHGDRLYMSTKLHGTVTGRFASRLHQVPRDPEIRSHIIAPDGWEMVVADYSQIELRLAAIVSNDQRMRMIFQTGGDIHTATAAFILGKPEDKLTKEERKMAKAVNFGLLYGMGWPKLVIYARDNYGVDMSDGQAKGFRTRYFETYSGLPVWHERQRRIVKAFGEVSSLSGRVRHLPGIYSNEQGVRAEAERQSINAPNQGFGSGDLKAMAMVEIHQKLPHRLVRIKGEVHDSILLWIKKDKINQMVPKVKAIMESPALVKEFDINLTVPLVADFEIGPWGKGLSLEDYNGR